jgi:hypothetical protein
MFSTATLPLFVHYYYLKNMDEYDRGMDPQTRAYLSKVIKSFFIGAIWLLLLMTFGLFMGFGVVHNGWHWYNIAFYIFAALSFAWLMRCYYRKWKSDFDGSARS